MEKKSDEANALFAYLVAIDSELCWQLIGPSTYLKD